MLPSRFVTGYLYGVSIDIFPLDVIGDIESEDAARSVYLKLRNQSIKIINKYHHYTGGVELRGFKKNLKTVNYNYMTKVHGDLSKHMKNYAHTLPDYFKSKKGDYVATIAGETIFKKEWFDKVIYVQFENHEFRAPEQYDIVLRRRYGDYMKFPPEEERTIPHKFSAYYI